MKDESQHFDTPDLDHFLDETAVYEAHALVRRLVAAGARLRELSEHVTVQELSDQHVWTAYDVLVHAAVLSKYYSVLAYRIGTGKVREIDLMPAIRGRDSTGQKLAGPGAREIADAAIADHARLIAYLNGATPAELRAAAVMQQGGSLTVDVVARQLLCGHLEEHLVHLEKLIAAERDATKNG
jgi:hypothetical protein